ncbi:MAG TPA: radical SAM protein [Candidatus Cloacimonetes bacterium]|nr:radical SAM protein [Candidatus Cloacimonadota bacterium]HEX37851.1 radical SAM protein [Candidatus Cloacimonadota bacterium]
MKSIKLLLKLILLRLSRHLYEKFILPVNYTVSVTYRCNSRCKTCNIYEKKCDELTVPEYDKIFKSIGNSAYWITMSGGEPFLRRDLEEIIQTIYDRCKPKIINIPTNGLLCKEIPKRVRTIAKNCPKSSIVINLSIDDIGSRNDTIRGIPGAYEKAQKTYKGLRKLDLCNLNIGIHTVISKFNVDHFHEISGTLMDLKPDSYITEIAENRVELGTMDEDISPSTMEYSQAIDSLLHIIRNTHFSGMNKITQTFRIEYYKMVKKLLKNKQQLFRCYAGILSAQIAPNGDVWPCCMKAVNVGNLKSYNYNFRKLWKKSKLLKEERRKIRKDKCFCPMANASYTNMLMKNSILFKAALRLFKK